MTEPTDQDRKMADDAIKAGKPNLPPLFEVDDWLWVAQSLGYVDWTDHDFEVRHRMDQIIAKILEYRAEDARRERGE